MNSAEYFRNCYEISKQAKDIVEIDEKNFEKSNNLENLFVILGNAAKKLLKKYKKFSKS